MATPSGTITAEDINKELEKNATAAITLDDTPVRILATTLGNFQKFDFEAVDFPPPPTEKADPVTFEDLRNRRLAHRYTFTTEAGGFLAWTDVNGTARDDQIPAAAVAAPDVEVTICSSTTPSFSGAETPQKQEQNNFLEYYVIQPF